MFCAVLVAGPLASAEAPVAPRPGPGHQRLGYFVGTWSTVGEFKPGPMGPAGPMTMTETCEWLEGGFAIVCHAEGEFPSGPSTSIGILGFNAEDGKYTYYGADDSGATMTTVSRGTVAGDTWTYENESPMGGRPVRTRVTMTVLSPTAYTFLLERQDEHGTWAPVIESKATKVGPR
jgi:hypothetical protein